MEGEEPFTLESRKRVFSRSSELQRLSTSCSSVSIFSSVTAGAGAEEERPTEWGGGGGFAIARDAAAWTEEGLVAERIFFLTNIYCIKL
jgi:hypothetical protein